MLLLVRAIMGLGEGVAFPTMQVCMQWAVDLGALPRHAAAGPGA